MMRMIRSAAALSILAAAATACAPTNTGMVSPIPSPSPSASATPDNPDQPGSPAPTPSASVEPGLNTVASLSGKVYNDEGSLVSGGKVMVKSLNSAKPFEAQAEIISGSYVMNQLPEGLLLEVSVVKDGHTKRSQTIALVPARDANVLNFGGAGNAHFIADYPEIEFVEPKLDAENVDAGKLLYTLRLSEALDDTNKRRFENALRLIPANAAANGGAAATDIDAAEDGGYPYDLTVESAGVPQIASYVVKRGSTFMGDAARRAKVSWDTEGRTATLEFDAPLLTAKDSEARYQVALVSEGERILDKNNKQLGTDASGSLNAYPAAGKLILGAFKAENIALKAIPGLTAGSQTEKWAATHENVGAFKLKKDEVAPMLQGIEVTKLATSTRVELTFNEPMAAYNGTDAGFTQAALGNLANYAFVVGKTSDDIGGVKLDGTPDANVDASAVASYGADGERAKEFKFTGGVTISVDPLDAKRVFLTIAKPNFFNTEVRDIKVRVEGAADPANNVINKSGADANIKMGAL